MNNIIEILYNIIKSKEKESNSLQIILMEGGIGKKSLINAKAKIWAHIIAKTKEF